MDSRRKRQLYSLLFLLLILGAVALIVVKGPFAPVEVQTTALRQGALHPALFGIGTVEALRSYTIGPNRSGRLLDLRVDHGDRVEKGELLGKMDPVDLPARLLSARKTLEKMEHSVESAQAQVNEVQARLQLARDEALRYQQLAGKGLTSQEQRETKQTEADALADSHRSAQASLEGTRYDLERAQAEVEVFQAQIDDLKLVAPVDGLITGREVEPGSVVMAGTTVLRMVDPGSLWVRTRINQEGSSALGLGLPAQILLRTRTERPLKGHVARLELIADSLTEERWVDVAFDDIPEGVAIGSLANVTIRLPVVEDTQWLPAAALRRHQGVSGVWTLRDGRAHFTEVHTGTRTLDGKVQILQGLEPDTAVIIYTPRSLTEGDKLKAVSR